MNDNDAPKKTGRPSKLTPELQEEVCKIILDGNYREVAARAVGIGRRTFHEWMRKGRDDPDGPQGAFRQAVLGAEMRAESNAVRTITQAGATDVDHLKWWLERKHPEKWGRETRRIREIEKDFKELDKVIRDITGKGVPEDTK